MAQPDSQDAAKAEEKPIVHRVLIVDDETENLDLLAAALRRGNKIFKAASGEEALTIMAAEEVHLVITDQRMPGISGTELLTVLQEKYPQVGRVLLTGFGDMETAVEAINKGKVHRFAGKPWDPDDIRRIVAEELERYDLVAGNERLTRDLLVKNAELQTMNEQLEAQKAATESLADEYRRQRKLAVDMSEKFARANLELIKAQEEIKLKNQKLESINRQLEQLSVTDGLTNFFNHRHMLRILDNEIGRARRYNLYLSVMMVDLDKFKEVNDAHGHLFGDAVLRIAADIIRRSIRETDSPTRYGGDEFLVILPHTGIERATFLAKRIHADLKTHVFHAPNGEVVRQTASIGIAYYPHPKADSRDALINLVDAAMYEAKQHGRDRIVVVPA